MPTLVAAPHPYPTCVLICVRDSDDGVHPNNDATIDSLQDYGLGSSVWGSDQEQAHRVGLKLEAGMTWINDHMSGGEQFPFGGIKGSGVGVEGGGQLGLKEFVDIKALKVPKPKPAKK